MSFRTILIEDAARIYLDLNSIVIIYKNETYSINLDEINVIIFNDLRCSITVRLLSVLCEKGITVIFTNTSHMPIGSLNTFFNHSRASKNILMQCKWDKKIISKLWTQIVREKIQGQIYTMIKLKKMENIELITSYFNNIEENDVTNREGMASKVYFKSLFGKDFKRFNDDMINYSLNYAYQIIRAKISQEIVNLGYSPAIGIFHKSEYNNYNLADDLIEVYRPLIDYFVYCIIIKNEKEYFDSDYKKALVNIINEVIYYDQKEFKMHNTIQLYLQSVFKFLINGKSEIKFPYLK